MIYLELRLQLNSVGLFFYFPKQRETVHCKTNLSADRVSDYLRKAEVIRLPPPAMLLSEGIKDKASDLNSSVQNLASFLQEKLTI